MMDGKTPTCECCKRRAIRRLKEQTREERLEELRYKGWIEALKVLLEISDSPQWMEVTLETRMAITATLGTAETTGDLREAIEGRKRDAKDAWRFK